jgi:hypothetical protein
MVIAEVRCRGMILNLLRVPRGDNFEVIGAARDCQRALPGDRRPPRWREEGIPPLLARVDIFAWAFFGRRPDQALVAGDDLSWRARMGFIRTRSTPRPRDAPQPAPSLDGSRP